MGKKARVVSVALGILLFAWADRSFSRMRGPQTPAQQQQWIREQQQKAEQQRLQGEQERLKYEEKRPAAQQDAHRIVDEYSDEAWQEALGATPEQWKAIKPRLEKVKKPEYPPVIRLSVYGFGGSGSSTSSSFSTAGGTGTASLGSGGGTTSAFASGGARGGGYSIGRSTGAGSAEGGGGASGFRPAGGVQGSAGPSGSSAGSFSSGGSAGSGGGYHFSIGGSGPVKKKVGEVNLGWQWSRPSLKKSPAQLSENEKTCEQLLDVLETKDPNPEQVRQCLEALRKIRAQMDADRKEARRQLREVVTPEQEAKLILMGYLD